MWWWWGKKGEKYTRAHRLFPFPPPTDRLTGSNQNKSSFPIRIRARTHKWRRRKNKQVQKKEEPNTTQTNIVAPQSGFPLPMEV